MLVLPDSTLYNIIVGPISVVGGICFGVIWGLMAKYVPEKGDVSDNDISFTIILVSKIL